jgi:hypothetical protein
MTTPWLTTIRLGRQVALLAAAALAAAAMLATVNVSSASAGNFCTYVWLAPYGSGGDRCWGPSQSTLNYAAVVTYERAGCVNIADGSNNLLASWVCGAAGSNPANAALSRPVENWATSAG